MAISRDDFNTWRENPVTEWVFKALETIEAAQKQHWLETSWDQKACEPTLLHELQVRADTARAIIDVSYDRLCEVLGDEPQE